MRKLISCFVAPLALALAAAPALAQGQARIFGKVTDESGQAVSGVRIVVTTAALETFRVEIATNDQGDYSLALLDATKTYLYRLEKEGYAPVEEEIKVGIGQNERHNFRMLTVAAAAAASTPGATTQSMQAVTVFNAGVEAYNQDDLATARGKFEEAIRLDPTLAAPHAALARLLLKQGSTAEAAAAAERALVIDAKNAAALLVAVEAYGKLGDKAKADAAAAALAAADPGFAAGTAYNRGVELYNEGQTAAAIAEFEKVIATDPSNAKAHYMLGTCYSGSDVARAKAHLQKFLELAPDDVDAPTAQEMLKYLK